MPKINTEPKAQLTVRIASETVQRLEDYSQETHIPKSVIVQIALDTYLKKQKPA